MAIAYVTVASGFQVSSAFVIEPANRACAFQVSSVAANTFFVEFSQSSGTGPWARFKRLDGTGLDYIVGSGAAGLVGVVPWTPTPFARIATGAATADVASIVVLPLNRG